MSARVVVEDGWRSMAGAQGGLVLGRLAEAAGAATGALVRSISAQLLAPVPPGELAVEATVDRAGRTSSVAVTLRLADGTLAATAHALTVAGEAGASRLDLMDPDPAVAADGTADPTAYDELVVPPEQVPFTRHVELRPTAPGRPMAGGDRAAFAGWVRLLPELSPLASACVLLDSFPPSDFAVLRGPALIPTVELTAHLVADLPPARTWLHLDQRALWRDDLLVVDDATLTATDGTLVGQLRQTRRLL